MILHYANKLLMDHNYIVPVFIRIYFHLKEEIAKKTFIGN